MVVSVTPTDQFPGKSDVHAAQSAAAGPHDHVQTGYGTATADKEGMFRVGHRGRRVLWIPEHATELKTRLMVCAHMLDAGHRGVAATVERLRAYCVWETMEDDVQVFVRERLFCNDYPTGGLVPRPLNDTVHGSAVGDVVHFDLLY